MAVVAGLDAIIYTERIRLPGLATLPGRSHSPSQSWLLPATKASINPPEPWDRPAPGTLDPLGKIGWITCMPARSGCWLPSARGRSRGRIDQLVEGQQVWPLIAWALIPGALLLVLLALRGERIAWPVRPRLERLSRSTARHRSPRSSGAGSSMPTSQRWRSVSTALPARCSIRWILRRSPRCW